MKDRFSSSGNRSRKRETTNSVKKELKRGRPSLFANLLGSVMTVGASTIGAMAGWQAAGPAGISLGIGTGVAVEGAKHYATAGFSAVMNRKGGKSGGGSGGGGDATVEGLRAAVVSVAEELTSSTSGAVLSAIQVIEESLNTFGTVTDGSSAYAVEEVKTQLANAFSSCDEARSLYTGAAESARAWAAGV